MFCANCSPSIDGFGCSAVVARDSVRRHGTWFCFQELFRTGGLPDVGETSAKLKSLVVASLQIWLVCGV